MITKLHLLVLNIETMIYLEIPLGKLSPITGAFITGDSALYFYTGVEASYSLGPIDIKPSFSQAITKLVMARTWVWH